ncbi:hypothetical protein [Synechococcus sp. PCC 6312]|uniref:hypothetical protein n=1 Tax=Synechococcus sp. (strain ATCC 27167 / PCC 6312) TaxID=195253 RepID=UPI00029EF7F1|nr:hypothetical protein [Synechococcus sp. PCC 6312]AFY59379.1 hypothetical protein Syn6312_0125 [Synechococcus sp. PCC 6312]
MLSFLALLPRSLTTFLYAVAALLRFYGNTNTIPLPFISLTLLDYSFWAFILGSTALLVNLGLEWHSGHRNRTRAEEERRRIKDREARQDDFAEQERDRADQERERAARRARIQNRFAILQIRYQLTPGQETAAPLRDFLAFLEEYGE